MRRRYGTFFAVRDDAAEAIRGDICLVAEAVAGHTERLGQHETRMARLEQRSS